MAVTIGLDITVTDDTIISNDITVTDPTKTQLILEPYDVFYDFRQSSLLTNNNADVTGYTLVENGSVSYNAAGYYDIGASTSDYLHIANNLAQTFPPLSHAAHTWFEMRFIFHVLNPTTSGIYMDNSKGGTDNGFRLEDSTSSNLYKYFLNGVEKAADTSADYSASGEDMDVRFYMYYDGTNTYFMITEQNENTRLEATVSGDMRQTSNADNTAFGVNPVLDKIYFIGWRHSNLRTQADFI